jgi:hypothetical protein
MMEVQQAPSSMEFLLDTSKTFENPMVVLSVPWFAQPWINSIPKVTSQTFWMGSRFNAFCRISDVVEEDYLGLQAQIRRM